MMDARHLRSFRLVCKEEHTPLVEALLSAQGFVFEREHFFATSRRLLREPLPLGASLAALFGYIYIQDRSSMLPALALSPGPGAAVLDMCASPGGKTGLLAQMAGPDGFILGNEPSKNRLATLRANLSRMNLFSCATMSHSGEGLPLYPASWSHILLDPPCSGWGTVEKNPKVLSLWQGDKLTLLIALQRRLLTEAYRLLRPGGRLAYSTCTTNVAENEEQVQFARRELGFTTLPLDPPPDFTFARSALSDVSGCLRVDTGPNGQGFFIALLQKPDSSITDEGDGVPQKGRGPKAPKPQTLAARYGKGQGGGRRGRSNGRARVRESGTASGYFLDRAALEGLGVDPGQLPPGNVAVFNGGVHFLPRQSEGLTPEGLAWKGFPLGRVKAGGEVAVDPALRGLMPERTQAESRGLPCLDCEDIDPLLTLLSGTSLEFGSGFSGAAEAGLYFRGLPLCRLRLKGKRAMLPSL